MTRVVRIPKQRKRKVVETTMVNSGILVVLAGIELVVDESVRLWSSAERF